MRALALRKDLTGNGGVIQRLNDIARRVFAMKAACAISVIVGRIQHLDPFACRNPIPGFPTFFACYDQPQPG